SLCSGTQVCSITEHLRQRNESTDHLTASNVIHTFDTSATGVDITDNITHVILRCGNLDSHDRLKKNRGSLLHRILESKRTCNMECHFRRVDFMVRTIVYICMYADYRISAKDTCSHSLFNTFAYCRNV